jgi:type IV pilus assembly protein PilW
MKVHTLMQPAPLFLSTKRTGRRPAGMRGFTLVELMVSVVIGLVTTVVVAQVLLFSEGQKRTTTSGADAQVNGAQAIYGLQRDLQMAGYGFSSSTNILGCPIYAKFNNVDIATDAATPTFPSILAPVVIDSTDVNRNAIHILGSDKGSYAIPMQVILPSYNPLGAGTLKTVFPVSSALGVRSGDLLLAAKANGSRCEVFKATADPTVDGQINREDEAATWNAAQFPSVVYSFGDMVVNLGTVLHHSYAISAGNALQLTRFSVATPASMPSPNELYPNIVILQALYGKDTNADGTVDTYDRDTPASAADWRQVLAIRVAVVAQSNQYEKEVVTSAKPLWDVGPTADVTPATTSCGSSKCITLNVDETVGADWQHYRYKVFDTVVPLLNLLWTS